MITTRTNGIFQGDVIIRTALIKAFDEMRKSPWLLDFAFAGLVNDTLTAGQYGIAELEKAKKWFMETEIPIAIFYHRDNISSPLIAVSLEESTEAESTLGDVSKEGAFESVDSTDIVAMPLSAAGPFTPTDYDSSTGIITVPANIDLSEVYPGMVIVDKKRNQSHVISDIYDDKLVIPIGVTADFTNTIVAPSDNLYIASIESCHFKETYRIDLYVSGNATLLIYLHSIVQFALLKYKQELFEARGFERMVVNAQGIRGFPTEGGPEFIYDRPIMLTGYVQHYWPKDIRGKLNGISVFERVLADAPSPELLVDELEEEQIGLAGDTFDDLESVGPSRS